MNYISFPADGSTCICLLLFPPLYMHCVHLLAKSNNISAVAQVNCHDDVINLLLDNGADVNKLNCEGMSALAVCSVLYYPLHSLQQTLAEKTFEDISTEPEVVLISASMSGVFTMGLKAMTFCFFTITLDILLTSC